MEDFESYSFTKKEYKRLAKLADYIYNLTVILDYFCSTQREYEELYNLTPLVKYLKRLADNLNCIFMEYPDKECINDLKIL